MAVGENKEWDNIEFYVDSGATETVVSEDLLSMVEVNDGIARKMGVQYEVANGVRVLWFLSKFTYHLFIFGINNGNAETVFLIILD